MVRGVVQGVGFRPYVYRLAIDMKLNGWALNSGEGVKIEVEGERNLLDQFLLRLQPESPPLSSIQSIEHIFLEPFGYSNFIIRPSEEGGRKRTLILPDLAICADCLRELFDPVDRRYRYPFLNCTHCGPRFSILEFLPYDRPNTTMHTFILCPDCKAEYEDPSNRRFHAQPTACSACGPHLEYWDETGKVISTHEAALQSAIIALNSGRIVALKGLGGFQLLADARDPQAVQKLRERKRREEKPFALMVPSLETARLYCQISIIEEHVFQSSAAPIVLLDRKQGAPIAENVAPSLNTLGVMIPYTPLHHLLMYEFGAPLVATSGNISDEPLCIDQTEALHRLSGIADCYLIHNRPIARPVDDSVVQVILGREQILRRARGYAPLPLPLSIETPAALAVGAQQKNTVALAHLGQVFLSQHIGDLESEEAYSNFKRTAADLPVIYNASPQQIVCDMHPDYLTTKYAEKSGLPVLHVQHHYAHTLACMAENDLLDQTVLGAAWDGTGYGLDGTIWGGEFLIVTGAKWERAAHLRTFPLPGGEAAIREPRRAALGLLFEHFGDAFTEWSLLEPFHRFSRKELAVLHRMLSRRLNSPVTSSAGRLFDGVAALIGVREINAYEGQAAILLEAAAEGETTEEAYQLDIIKRTDSPMLLDWGPMLEQILADIQSGSPVSLISARFHNSLIRSIVDTAAIVGIERVALTGGCFLNRRLLERAVNKLIAAGFRPVWHQRVPTGDGGIALGQIAAAAIRHREAASLVLPLSME